MNIHKYGIVYNRYIGIKWDKDHGTYLLPHKETELKRLKSKLNDHNLLK